MEARVDEIAPEIFRIAVWTGKAPITFNQFVIRDESPPSFILAMPPSLTLYVRR